LNSSGSERIEQRQPTREHELLDGRGDDQARFAAARAIGESEDLPRHLVHLGGRAADQHRLAVRDDQFSLRFGEINGARSLVGEVTNPRRQPDPHLIVRQDRRAYFERRADVLEHDIAREVSEAGCPIAIEDELLLRNSRGDSQNRLAAVANQGEYSIGALNGGLSFDGAEPAGRLDVTFSNNHAAAALGRLPVLIHQLLAFQQDFDLARALGGEMRRPSEQKRNNAECDP